VSTVINPLFTSDDRLCGMQYHSILLLMLQSLTVKRLTDITFAGCISYVERLLLSSIVLFLFCAPYTHSYLLTYLCQFPILFSPFDIIQFLVAVSTVSNFIDALLSSNWIIKIHNRCIQYPPWLLERYL